MVQELRPKILKTGISEYVAQTWTGLNESGAIPVGDNVLVLPDEAADKTSGGVFIDPRTQERNTLASETGIIVAIGDGAFKWSADRTRPFDGTRPEVGQRVYFQRYAGQIVHGDDGKTYRCMSDNVVGAVKASA